MVDISDLLKKQDNKLKAKHAILQNRVRLERAGAVRPWQEGLPQYQKETTGDSNGEQAADNRGQSPQQRGTTGDSNGGRAAGNRGQGTQKRGTTGDKNGGQAADNGGQHSRERGATGDTNGRQDTRQRETTGDSPPKNTTLSPVTDIKKPTPTLRVPQITPLCPPLQPGTNENGNGGQFPKAPQEIALLFCLAKEVSDTGLGTTRVLKNNELADLAKIKRSSFKKVRNRLLASGHCSRDMAGQGRDPRAGCIYSVSEAALTILKNNGGQIPPATGDKLEASLNSSSRSFNKETTTKAQDQKMFLERFEVFLQRINPHEKFRIDSADVFGWWRKVQVNLEMTDEDLEDFEESLERWIFKYSTTKFSEGSDPKAILSSGVLRGLCGKVPGFVSWRDKHEQALAESRRERMQRHRQRQLDEYNDNFELWFAEADDDALWACVPEASRETVKAPKGKPLQRGIALKGTVKEQYAEANNIDFEHWQHLVDQFS